MLGALRRSAPAFSRLASSSPSGRLFLRDARPHITGSNGGLKVATTRSLFNAVSWRQQAQQVQQEQAENDGQPEESKAITEFDELRKRNLVDTGVINNITRGMGLSTMTEVQSRTIQASLQGIDVIAQAKTGTGKTIAFLLPILQRIIQEDPGLSGVASRYERTTASDIRAIIISPTRELAEQIGEEARRLTQRTKIIVQTAVGGTQKALMLRKTQAQGCHMLVGTPGRLRDLLEDQYSGVAAPKLAAFVLDEADRLLDQGFLPEIEAIMDQLPNPRENPRQTMMFSATIPTDVISLVRRMLKPGFQFVKCIRDDEAPTHERVPQKVVEIQGLENRLPAILELAQREIQAAQTGKGRPFKALIFFNSTAEVTAAAAAFRNLRGATANHPLYPAKVLEIHAKLSQAQRTRTTDTFKHSSSAILFSSDVTARGMDFPNVTHVIQVGVPQSRDQYIHRIGRTGRAGKEGEGWLLISPLEHSEARDRLRDLPMTRDSSLTTAEVDMSKPAQLPAQTARILTDISEAVKLVDRPELGKAYLALFGTFQWLRSKHELVQAMNRLSRYGWGLEEPPVVPASLAQRLGLSRIPGLNVVHAMDSLNGRSRAADRSSSRGSSRSWDWSRDSRNFGGSSPSGSRSRSEQSRSSRYWSED